jgi:uncharacterized protein
VKIAGLIVGRPQLVIFLCLLPIVGFSWFLPSMLQDLRSDAFLADDNPALVYKRKVKEEFGLSDPLVVAVVSHSPSGVFNPPALRLIQSLTREISGLPNINASRVASLSTEMNISATREGMEIAPFYEEVPEARDQLDALQQAVSEFPLYIGSLVSADGQVALIVAEMIDEDKAGQSYKSTLEIIERAAIPVGVELHVAGEGAIIGYLGEYVDADARQLVPFCALVIFLVLIVAYHGILPAVFTLVIVVATLSITMGAMAASGVPFYVITNALPVILIGISVADSIHIYLHYFDLQQSNPEQDFDSLVRETISTMWRPVSLTSLTTMAGFLGLYFAAYMPPFKYFGLFAAVGVLVAWLYSLFFLPAVMVLTRARASKWYVSRNQRHTPGLSSRLLGWLGGVTCRHALAIVIAYAFLAAVGLYGASYLVVDENPINVFNSKEPVVQADRIINEHLNGANTLDIVIETPNAEDLFLPENLRKIEDLQQYVATLPEVGGSVSIVDYLKQMNRSLNGGAAEAYRLPDGRDAIAQYFLIYAATSDPTDFEEEVDYDYRTANVRVYVKSGDYSDVKIIVEALLPYLQQNFNCEQIKASLSGRVNVHYRWISELARSHFIGLAVAASLVLLVSALLLRSLVGGILTLLPVASAILLVYAVMAGSGIPLGMGTSMFAAVAVGLGIDYSIHTLERMRVIYNETGQDMEATFGKFYPTTGKALLFNFLAIAGGFGVLTVSKISSLNIFGAVVVLAVSVSFLASMTLLPALLKVFTPQFIRQVPASNAPVSTGMSVILSLSLLLVIATVYSSSAEAGDEVAQLNPIEEPVYSAEDVVAQVNAVPEGEYLSRQIEMLMTDRRGKQRSRKTISFRKTYEDQKRTVLFYLEPANVRDTGFLIWDYTDPGKDDDQWLYLPALRKVRRISASDRGDYFLGTDFTYEDMKLDGKLEPLDYNFSLLGREDIDGIESYKLEATTKNETIAKELGYSRTVVWVNPANWMILRAKFWDTKGAELKTLAVGDIRQIDGIWTRHQLQLVNHQTGHQTEFVITEVDYTSPVDDDLFTKMALERGR